MKFIVRKIAVSDVKSLVALDKKSARIQEGIARTENEITEKYIEEVIDKSINGGLGLVIEDENGELRGALTSFKFIPSTFRHTLGNMTLVVDPDCFGNGLGKKLFTAFTQEIANNRPDIARAELNVRQTNKLAISIYESVGFVVEGIQKNRLLDSEGKLSDDTMMAWLNPNFKY